MADAPPPIEPPTTPKMPPKLTSQLSSGQVVLKKAATPTSDRSNPNLEDVARTASFRRAVPGDLLSEVRGAQSPGDAGGNRAAGAEGATRKVSTVHEEKGSYEVWVPDAETVWRKGNVHMQARAAPAARRRAHSSLPAAHAAHWRAPWLADGPQRGGRAHGGRRGGEGGHELRAPLHGEPLVRAGHDLALVPARAWRALQPAGPLPPGPAIHVRRRPPRSRLSSSQPPTCARLAGTSRTC